MGDEITVINVLTAAEAKELSNPALIESYTRFQQVVADAIKQGAMDEIGGIVIRIPTAFSVPICQWLHELGYAIKTAGPDMDRFSFYDISWV